jgi:serine/threonine protein kinase
MTKDPETKEFIMVLQFANMGNLREVLSNNFNYILWKDKIKLLYDLIYDLQDAHRLEQVHKNFHSGNILRNHLLYYISDFGLSGSANEKKLDNKICGVLPYIAPEVLNGKPYTSSSDIYSFGVIMVELSSGYPPFYDRKHDLNLALNICNGLRPEFGRETPYNYKKLAHRCMNANSNERPKANELYHVLNAWNDILYNNKIPGHKEKKFRNLFNESISPISTLYEKSPDAIYVSREFTFSNLPVPVNSPTIISHYLKENINDQGICFLFLFPL